MLFHISTKPLAVIAAAVVIGGGAYGIHNATAGSGSSTTPAVLSASTTSGQFVPRGGGSNARSGPAAGGASGTIASVSASGFTLTTAAGQEVTVETTASTDYPNGASSASASAVSKGEPVVVLGTVDGQTITAGQVIAQPTNGAESGTSSAAVVPFQRGAPSTSRQIGQIPAGYSQGSGTIVSGATANLATQAALAAYPGGIVDRVVKLSSGEYEVHNIGVNWPHHIFVDQSYQVIGAD